MAEVEKCSNNFGLCEPLHLKIPIIKYFLKKSDLESRYYITDINFPDE